MITCRDLARPRCVPRMPSSPLPLELRARLRTFPREVLVAQTGLSPEVLERLAAGEHVKWSARMFQIIAVLSLVVKTGYIPEVRERVM